MWFWRGMILPVADGLYDAHSIRGFDVDWMGWDRMGWDIVVVIGLLFSVTTFRWSLIIYLSAPCSEIYPRSQHNNALLYSL